MYKSRKHKLLFTASSSLVAALAIAACGTDDDAEGTETTSTGCTVTDAILTCEDGTSYDLSDLAAANGSAGKDGNTGKDGDAGQNGDAGVDGENGTDGTNGTDGAPGADGTPGMPAPLGARTSLTRLATVPLGAEVTGAFLTDEGTLFFNVQHPDSTNASANPQGKVFDKGTVGYLAGVNINKLPKDLISVPVPQTLTEQETVQVAYGEYQVLAQTGDTFGGTLPGGVGHVYDATGAHLVAAVDDPDFNGYLSTGTGEGYLYTNWESIPGGMSRVKIKTEGGLLVVDESTPGDNMMLDFGTYGTIANCFGSMSPWGTPLTSEEWGNSGDSTHNWNNAGAGTGVQDLLAAYTDNAAGSAAAADPFPNTYRYHYIVEITDPTAANPVAVKHYAMGRFEHENSIVMPDQKTVFLSQDDSDGVFFKFVADTAGDLSSGTLFAAKLTQDAGSTEPLTTGFDIEWIELATSNNAAIAAWAAEYDDINFNDFVSGESSYLTDADAEAWAAGDATYPTVANGGGQVTAGQPMDDRIAFLEPRKAARALGATDEWRKFEGVYANMKRAEEAIEGTDLVPNENVETAYVYFAISDLDSGMVDDEGDMQLSTRVKDCGGVYRMPLVAGYDVLRIEPVVMGSTMRSGVSSSLKCDVNSMAQPDNVIVMNDGRIIVGEDGSQTNNALWLYDPGTR